MAEMTTLKVKKGDKVKLEKISDDKFDGYHPNGIGAGYYEFGELINDLALEERCIIVDRFRRVFTSVVTQIVDETTFKTKNSTYCIIPKTENTEDDFASADSEEGEMFIEELNNIPTA